jgi:beta-lactamase regulating signal transducer with metallopeptidase domain
MNALLTTAVPSLAWALLDFVWQGLLVGWAAALALGMLRRARPQTRYAVACAALLLCAALPLAGTIERILDTRSATTTLLPLAVPAAGNLAGIAAGDAATGTDSVLLATDQLASWEHALQIRLPLVMLLWSAGAAALALRMLLGLLWVRRLGDASRSRSDPVWQARVTQQARRFGITRPVRLGLVDDLPSPVTAGWWRPVVLLPASLASGMPVELLEALLAHEMAHIRRHDYLINLLQSAIEIVLFYHPTVWWLSGRIRLEREQIADDLAASMLGEPRRLALALSELDRYQLSTTNHLAHAAHGGNLMNRIKRLVRPEFEPLNWKMALPILGLSAACAAFYANAQTAPAAPAAEANNVVLVAELTNVAPGGAEPMTQAAQVAPAKEAAPAAPMSRVSPVPPVPPVPPLAAPMPPLAPVPPVAPVEPVAPVAPIAPDAEPAPRRRDRAERRATETVGREDAYAFVRAGDRGLNISGSTNRADWRELESIKRAIPGEFLWFRDGGKTYVVRDAGVLAKVSAAWAPLDKLGAQMEVHGKEMEKHGKVMEALGHDMERAAVNVERSRDRTAERKLQSLGRDQGRLGRQMEKLGRQMETADAAKRDSLQREMDQLNLKMRELDREMELQSKLLEAQHERIERGNAPMEELGRKMEEAGKPMDALGKKMDVLGKQMDTESRAAEKVVRGLIKDAQAKGLAAPSPAG